MRRFVAAATLALLAVGLPASAEGYGLSFAPPYARLSPTGTSSVQYPCTPATPRTSSLRPDAAGGRLDWAVSVTVRRCRSYADTFYERWDLGPVPAAFVDMPAVVVAVVRADEWWLVATGSGRRAASIALKVGTLSPLGGTWWTIAGIDCARSCTRTQPDSEGERLRLTGMVSYLPESLAGLIRAEASASGTGSVLAQVRGVLESVTIFPLAPFPYA